MTEINIPIEEVIRNTVTLFVVMDPIGTIPIITGFIGKLKPHEKRSVIKNAIITIAILLFAFSFVGAEVLNIFNVEISSFMIAGGVLLFIVAIEFLTHGEWRIGGSTIKQESGIVPIAFPLLSGPGALTVVMISFQTSGLVVTLISTTIAVAATYLALLLAEPIYRLLGRRGSMIVTRVFAIFIAAIAIQFIIDGVKEVMVF